MTNDAKTHLQRVLIVDDQITNILVLNEILRPHVELFMARNGEEALAQSLLIRPDLILLDVIMPGIDGYEVCRRLKANPATNEIPVLFVTGRDSEEDENLGFSVGALDFIIKPFRSASVLAKVQVHLLIRRQAEQLRALALSDGLTGVANRRHFDSQLDVEWRRTRRSGQPLTLIMIDVDHLKAYNDHFGHLAGDSVLRQVAQALAACLKRPCDLLARYGGEEFVALLPDTNHEGGLQVAEAMGAAVTALNIQAAPGLSNPLLTISRGLSCALASNTASDTHSLCQSADEALYSAKKRGRNCSVAAVESG